MYLDHSAGDRGPAISGCYQLQPLQSYYDLGLACSSADQRVDVVEAHMWFNLAAMFGDRRGIAARSDLAEFMSERQVSEAQRRARLYRGRL